MRPPASRGDDGPGCPACERTGEGRYRYEAIDVLGIVVRRIDVRENFQIEEWANTLMLARVTVPFRSKDSNVVERECLLVEYGQKKTVYLPAHPTFQEEGMPRWRKQLSLVDDAPDEGPSDKAPRAQRTPGDGDTAPAARPGEGQMALEWEP